MLSVTSGGHPVQPLPKSTWSCAEQCSVTLGASPRTKVDTHLQPHWYLFPILDYIHGKKNNKDIPHLYLEFPLVLTWACYLLYHPCESFQKFYFPYTVLQGSTSCFNFLRQNKPSSLSLSLHIMYPTIITAALHWIPSLLVFMCLFYWGALNWVKHFRCSLFLFWNKVSLLLHVKKCKGMWGLVWSTKTQSLHFSFYSDRRQRYIWKISPWFLDCNLIWTEILSKVTSHPAHILSRDSTLYLILKV